MTTTIGIFANISHYTANIILSVSYIELGVKLFVLIMCNVTPASLDKWHLNTTTRK